MGVFFLVTLSTLGLLGIALYVTSNVQDSLRSKRFITRFMDLSQAAASVFIT